MTMMKPMISLSSYNFIRFFLVTIGFLSVQALSSSSNSGVGSAATIAAAAATTTTNPLAVELKYFNARGAAETSRLLLILSGEEYIDTRYDINKKTFDSPDFKKAKEAGELVFNLNRVPLLLVPSSSSSSSSDNNHGDITTIGQSRSIERYLAKRLKLMGNTDEEYAIIDCITEHCRDVKDAQARKGFSMFNKDKTEEEKEALRKEWFTKDLPEMLYKIEQCIHSLPSTSNEGDQDNSDSKSCFVIGSSITYADVAIFALIRDGMLTYKEEMECASKKCTKLNQISDTVAANPRIAKWLEERPSSMF